MSYIGKIKFDGGTALPVGSTLYGTATWDGVNNRYNVSTGVLANVDTLIEGLTVHIKFNTTNTHTSPTLKIGNFAEKPIHRVAGTSAGITEDTSWPNDAIVTLTYDGTAWVINSSTEVNTKYTFTEGTTTGAFSVSTNGGTAVPVLIHGLKSAAYTESSAYATAAQGILASNAMPKSGGQFTGNVSFDSNTTLSINAPTADGHAATKKYVDDTLNSISSTMDAMIFKGTIGAAQDSPTYTSLPTKNYKKGWTYKVITAGTYAEKTCKVGDLIIAINDGPSSGNAAITSDWTVVSGNLEDNVTTTDGANGYLVKFTGPTTIAKLVALSNNGTGFLRQDGTWATPDIGNSLGIDTDITTDLIFLHKSGDWKTLSVVNAPAAIASVQNGLLTISATVAPNATLTMTAPSQGGE